MKTATVREIRGVRGGVVGLLGLVLTLAGITAFVASVLDLIGLREANLLLASGGAIALGLIFVATSLFLRLREAQEAHLLDAELFLAKREVADALALSEELGLRFEKAGIRRNSKEE